MVNITPWPMNTSSSIVTPSQMKACDEILQSATDRDFFLDLDEWADAAAIADRAFVNIDEIGMRYDDVITLLNI